MQVEKITSNNIDVANISANETVLFDTQSAVDLMMTVNYETGIKNIAVSKDLIDEKFFILSSGLAGEILQKFTNYQFRIAIYGDFSNYTSKPLKDFIYESNNGQSVFFTDNLESAIQRLTSTKRI